MASAHNIIFGSTTFGGPILQYDLQSESRYNDKGEVEYVDVLIFVRAAYVEATAALNVEGIIAKLDLPHELAQTVSITLDGTEKYLLDPSDCFIGPVVTNFRTDYDEGAGESHWRYQFTIYARQRPDTATNTG